MFELVEAPLNGSITLENGQVRYVPHQDYFGNDSFAYRANDGELSSELDFVSIVIEPVNDAPEVVGEDVSLASNGDISIDVSANDIDSEGDLLSIELVVEPPFGTANVVNGLLVYAPNSDYIGEDSLSYRVFDGTSFSEIVTVAITVTGSVTPTPTEDTAVHPSANVRHHESQVSVGPDGRSVIGFSAQDAGNSGQDTVGISRFDAAGSLLGTTFLGDYELDGFFDGDAFSVCALENGRSLVVMGDTADPNHRERLVAQYIDAEGALSGAPIVISTENAIGRMYLPHTVRLSDG
jgi:hypothetical protein